MKLDDFDIVLFDLDGTVYYGSKLIDGANSTPLIFFETPEKEFILR